MIGTTLGHFRILGKLADSGSGEIFRAEDEALCRAVALEVLAPALASDPGQKARFLGAARAAAAVTHPNLAAIHEVGESDGRVWVAMELVEGATLRARLKGRPLPLLEMLKIGEQVAEGLAAAHGKGLAHGDLKPEKVLLGPGGQVKVIELGLSAARADSLEDVYRLGALLYEMATGETPRPAATPAETTPAGPRREGMPAEGVETAATPAGVSIPPSTLNPGISAELDRIVGACLEPNPTDRYQDMGALATDLGTLRRLTDTAPESVRSGEAAAHRRTAWSARRIALWAAASVALAAALGFGGWRWIGPLIKPGPPFKVGDRIIMADWDVETGDMEIAVAIREILEPNFPSEHLTVIEQDPGRREGLTPAVLEERCGRGECEGYITGRIKREGDGFVLEAALWRAGRSEPVAKVTQRAVDETGLGEGLLILHKNLIRALPGAVGAPSAPPAAETCPISWPSIPAINAWQKAELYQFQNPAEMMTMLKRALELAPGFPPARDRLGLAFLNMGNMMEARRHLGEATRGYAALAETHAVCREWELYYEILYLAARHDTAARLERLNRFVQLYPDNGDMRIVLASAIMRESWDIAAAEPHFRRCYELSPIPGHFSGLVGNLAAQGKAGDIEALIAEYRAREKWGDPAIKDAALARAEINLAEARGEDWNRIVDLVDRLLAEDRISSQQANRSRGAFLGMAGRLREAEQAQRERVKGQEQAYMKTGQDLWPPDVDLLWLEQRRTGRAPALAPEHLRYLHGDLDSIDGGDFGVFSVETGRAHPLEEFLRHHEAAEQDNMNSTVRAKLQFGRGCLALIQGRAAEAVALLQPLARESDAPWHHWVLGRAYEAARRWNDAARAYEIVLRPRRLVGIQPYAARILGEPRLAAIYERLGNSERARYWYGRFLEEWRDADPGTPEVEDARRRLAALGGPGSSAPPPG